MLTLVIQAFVADFMSNTVAPAIARAVVSAVPAAPPAAVQAVVGQIFSPSALCLSEEGQKAWLAALTASTLKEVRP